MTRNIRSIVAAFTVFLALGPDGAVAKVDTHKLICPDEQTIVDNVLDGLKEADAFVPLVPSEEMNYLQTEWENVYKARSEARLDAVIRRPYYNPWQFHKELGKAVHDLISAQRSSEGQDLKSKIKLFARIPAYLSDVKVAWNDYLKADPLHVLTEAQIYKAGVRIGSAPFEIAHYVWCLADEFPEK